MGRGVPAAARRSSTLFWKEATALVAPFAPRVERRRRNRLSGMASLTFRKMSLFWAVVRQERAGEKGHQASRQAWCSRWEVQWAM